MTGSDRKSDEQTLGAEKSAAEVTTPGSTPDESAGNGRVPGHEHATELVGGRPNEFHTELNSDATSSDIATPEYINADAEIAAGKTVIKDRFVLEDLMGTGGMGRVYRARDLRMALVNERVASRRP